MYFSHFLQANNVCIKLIDCQSDVVDLQALARAQAIDALVDVPRGDPNGVCHLVSRRKALGVVQFGHRVNRASCKQASALEGEKHRSAAS